MFGFFRTLIYIALLIVVAAGFCIWHFRIPTVRHLLSTVLNNPVEIQDIDLSLSLSRLSGKNVAIINPKRSQDAATDAIKARVLEIKTPFRNLFGKKLVIDEIVLDRVDFFVDMYNINGSKSNVKTIIDNIHTRAHERFPEGKPHTHPVIIKKIILQDVHFSYRNPILTVGTTKLPKVSTIVINNVGTGKPVSTAQIASLVTATMLRKFVSLAGFKDLLESLPQLPIHWLKEIFIHHNKNEKAVSLQSYLDVKSTPNKMASGLFQKIFAKPFKEEDEEAV